MSEMPVARVRIEYKIWRAGEEEPLVEGYTLHSFINAETGRPTRAPQMLLQAIGDELKASKGANV
jgi:acyl-CoA thioesterase FadM